MRASAELSTDISQKQSLSLHAWQHSVLDHLHLKLTEQAPSLRQCWM